MDKDIFLCLSSVVIVDQTGRIRCGKPLFLCSDKERQKLGIVMKCICILIKRNGQNRAGEQCLLHAAGRNDKVRMILQGIDGILQSFHTLIHGTDPGLSQRFGITEQALQEYDQMRLREGQKLHDDIADRLCTIEDYVSEVERRSPETVEEYRQRLYRKMSEVLANTALDEQRILLEAGIFADKVAVDEETVRLRSHIAQMRGMLQTGSPIGRKMDFLVQEFNRESNTIGSKCSDGEITKIVIELKSEIEKIREQIQNIE